MDPRSRRSPARFLAPVALATVIVASLAMVSGSGTTGSSPSPGNGTQTSKTSASTTGVSTTTKRVRRTYTVKVGDTLGGIAVKTGVPLTKLQELNPSVDPHAMTAGQKIRLR
jgi:LysM repeat protein